MAAPISSTNRLSGESSIPGELRYQCPKSISAIVLPSTKPPLSGSSPQSRTFAKLSNDARSTGVDAELDDLPLCAATALGQPAAAHAHARQVAATTSSNPRPSLGLSYSQTT